MHTKEIVDWGEKHVPHFVGVFPLNRLPPHLMSPSNFIVNTDTHNLPGTHWLAVSYQKPNIIHVFDPFGLFYPHLLRQYLHRLRHRGSIQYNNSVMLQNIHERNCGWYCLAWLMAINEVANTQNYARNNGSLFY